MYHSMPTWRTLTETPSAPPVVVVIEVEGGVGRRVSNRHQKAHALQEDAQLEHKQLATMDVVALRLLRHQTLNVSSRRA